jgi:hypothetical protein
MADGSVPWSTYAAAAPEHAAQVEALFKGHPHHVLATVRPDGAPRVGGTSVFVTDGELWIGMMAQAARAADLRRDPRCALHTAPLSEALDPPDARLDLIARELPPDLARARITATGAPDGDGLVFTLDVRASTLVRVAGEELVLERWTPGAGIRVRRLG